MSINELVVGVNIALDIAPISNCPALDQPLPTETPTSLEVRTRQPTSTPRPTRTSIPDSENTRNPTAAACVGDCDGSGAGSVDGAVSIDELIVAVNNALNGCPEPVPTATPTGMETAEPTATPTGVETAEPTTTPTGDGGETPTVTPEATETTTPQATDTATEVPTDTPTQLPTETGTPEPDLDVVAGSTTVVLNGVNAIPNLISAIVAGVVGPGGGAGQGSGAGDVDPCELGGTSGDSGSLTGAGGLTITLDMCEVSRPGGSVVFDGTINVTITALMGLTQATGTASVQNLTVEFKDGMGQTTLTTSANLSAAVVLTVRLALPADVCDFDISIFEFVLTKVDLVLTGTLSSQTADGALVSMTFEDTMASLTIQTYGAGCVPTDYVLELDGGAQVVQMPGGGGGSGGSGTNFTLFFVDFVIDASGNEVDMSGKITADCFGGTVTLATPQSIVLLLGEFCPEAGQVDVQDLGDIFYNNGAVTVDSDDGEPMMYPSCLDPALLACIG